MASLNRARQPAVRDVHLVSGRTEEDVAVVLVVENDLGICWYNRRLVYGRTLDLVRLWATMTTAEGWHFAALRSADLAGLD